MGRNPHRYFAGKGSDTEAAEWELRLAEAREAQGNWTEASKALERSVSRAKESFWPNKLSLSILLNNGTELYRRHEAPDLARGLYEKAIELRRSAGKRDIKLAQFLHNFAFLYQESSNIERAAPLLL